MALESVTTPNSLSDMKVEDALKLRAIEKKLQMESVLDDIFEDLGEEVVGTGEEVRTIPDAIFLKLSGQATGTRQVTVPFLQNLAGPAHIGKGTPIGSEIKQNLKYATFFYDEYSQAVAAEAWGVDANDVGVYGLYEKIQPQLSQYMREFRGQRIREALLFTHDSVLTNGTHTSLAPSWNSNWFIANTEIGSQPGEITPYIPNEADSNTEVDEWTIKGLMTNKIGAAMHAAIGSNTTDAEISLNYLRALDYFATNVAKIKPITVSGKKTYIVLIPSTQVNKLKANEQGQLGDIYTGMVRSNQDEMSYTGVLGRVGSLLLVEDQRYPTIACGRAGSVYTAVVEFVRPGDVDERVKTPGDIAGDGKTVHMDIGFLLGKAALAEFEVKGLHFEYEKQNYGYNEGTGAFGESGISAVEYDIDPSTGVGKGSSKENSGSISLAWATPAITV